MLYPSSKHWSLSYNRALWLLLISVMLLLLPVLQSNYAIGLKDHMLPESIQNVESALGSPTGTQDNLMELSVFGLHLIPGPQ